MRWGSNSLNLFGSSDMWAMEGVGLVQKTNKCLSRSRNIVPVRLAVASFILPGYGKAKGVGAYSQ